MANNRGTSGPVCRICDPRKTSPTALARIEAQLRSGATYKALEGEFGIPDDTLKRHHVRHMPPPAALDAPAAPATVEPVSLRSAEDVLSALEWSVSETRALLQRAKDAGDLRLQNQLLQTCIGALDKLAKSVGLYDDGAKITVNTGEQRILNVIAGLSTEELRAHMRGEKRLQLPGGDA